MAKNLNKTRSEQQMSENQTPLKVDAPESRFQVNQQEDESSRASTAQVEPFVKKKAKAAGPVLKQEVIADVISKNGVGGPSGMLSTPSTYGLRDMSFSGDTGTILGDASGTPSMGRSYQGASRLDKRISDSNKSIDFNASEQIAIEYDHIPALADSESTVGYNGNPKNVSARSQKKTGFSSAEMLYDRSLDFIEKDAFVYSVGQVVKQDGVTYSDYPTLTYDPDNAQANDRGYVPFTMVRGNYAPRELRVDITRDADTGTAYVSAFAVDEDNLSCNGENDQTVNMSATNHKIDMNRAELARQTIDAEAGSPTAQHFNPLGRSVEQPTATVAFLQDLENADGAEIFAAYRFANKARGHYLNRTAKDGQDLVGPALDALYGHLYDAVDMDSLRAGLNLPDGDLFSHPAMAAGSAALMIPLFDSINKYHTKADIVNQPRGLKMHIQTADNNIDPFRVKKDFIAALNYVDTYSTIDHEYDPTLPVCITDNVRLIHPYSWAETLAFTATAPGVRHYSSRVFSYAYSAGSGLNSYIIKCGAPLLNGVAYFLDLHASAIYHALRDQAVDNTVSLTIPIVHSTTHFSLWDLLVCASTPYIIYERTNTLKDILDFEQFYSYPLLGNVSLSSANPMAAVNYGMPSALQPLTVKQMTPSSAMMWKYPELFIRVGADMMAPYYFNERSFTFGATDDDDIYGTSTLIPNGSGEFTTPVVRSGAKLGVLDDFFAFDVKDVVMMTDRLTRLPVDVDGTGVGGYVYKYSQESDGIPMLRAGSFLTAKLSDIYSTPRLLGWFCDAPAGVCAAAPAAGAADIIEAATLTGLTAMNSVAMYDINPSFRAIEYKGYYAPGEPVVDQALDVGSVNVNRAQAFRQIWAMFHAGSGVHSRYFDLAMSANAGMEWNNEAADEARFVTLRDNAMFSPFTYGPYRTAVVNGRRRATNTAQYLDADLDTRPIVFSPHYMFWTILQKLPFAINPFDCTDLAHPAVDPFGWDYLFGLAGFMSANYDEELYNRANLVQNQGYGYTQDPFMSGSIIFKQAADSVQM